MDYKTFKNELENYYKYLKSVEKIKEEIENIIYEMTGVKGIRYDKEPTSFNPQLSNERILDLIDKKEEKEIELDYTIASIRYIERKLSKLDKEDKEICLKIISEGISAEKVRREVGYSKSGIWKRIKRELTGIL